ncbi:Sporulation and spore germination [Thermanaeromonas toyohensis ToBE]|uniref:Sporulation and spore germination n=1 Tax=Thermanaeromonas toyohensis ToBE TaxID=698762 RepID=A0A1W1VH77_9FIRM|nr:GerMN domain-containing protein [Thermanaeromonas toyohensis]SMB92570.1 Sporulation and spore germination [Thermanaeromonas toyohensis ToBE]
MWRIVGLLVVIVFLLSGCGLAKNLSGKKGSQIEVQTPQQGISQPEKPQLTETQETRKVILYFSDPSGQKLVAEERVIPKVEGIARATIEELIKGPAPGSKLLPTIPKGTVLKDINIRPDGLARVDFSKELITNHSGGSLGESLTVYSIVNTLTQFPTVKQVQILVEGKVVDTIAGHVDVSSAMTRNEAIIKK